MAQPQKGASAKPVVLGARHTQAEAEKFDRKRGHLSRSEAVRLALEVWPGLPPQ